MLRIRLVGDADGGTARVARRLADLGADVIGATQAIGPVEVESAVLVEELRPPYVPGLGAPVHLVVGVPGAAGFVHVRGPLWGRDPHGQEHPEHVVVDADPGRPVNVNIRPVGAPVWRATLLFRDFLRAHPHERDAYAAMKSALAGRPGQDVDRYSDEKMPWIYAALARADAWAGATGWEP